jgi:hypothetical protein
VSPFATQLSLFGLVALAVTVLLIALKRSPAAHNSSRKAAK